MGIAMIFFISPLLNLLGLDNVSINIPMFHQTAGLLAIILGLILFFSSLDVEKYLLNIVLIIYLRFLIQIILVINILLISQIAWGLIMFGVIDFIFAIISIYLIRVSHFNLNIIKIIQNRDN
jgi:hypothetical protein